MTSISMYMMLYIYNFQMGCILADTLAREWPERSQVDGKIFMEIIVRMYLIDGNTHTNSYTVPYCIHAQTHIYTVYVQHVPALAARNHTSPSQTSGDSDGDGDGGEGSGGDVGSGLGVVATAAGFAAAARAEARSGVAVGTAAVTAAAAPMAAAAVAMVRAEAGAGKAKVVVATAWVGAEAGKTAAGSEEVVTEEEATVVAVMSVGREATHASRWRRGWRPR